jgi:hypothetical protein
VLKHAVGYTSQVMLQNMQTILDRGMHDEQLEKAMWHLDHAGGVLLRLKNLNLDGTSHCLCTKEIDSCGLGVLAVPAGYKVVVMR